METRSEEAPASRPCVVCLLAQLRGALEESMTLHLVLFVSSLQPAEVIVDSDSISNILVSESASHQYNYPWHC